MYAPRNTIFVVLSLALTLAAGAVQAAPQTGAPAVPDYGGRDSAPLTVGDAAPNPAAQAGRALEALVVVLAGVVGVVYVLKRFNLVQLGANGKPARISASHFGRSPRTESADVAVVSSQTLPGGAMLHVVRVGGKNLLLAATAQSVTNVAEWSIAETSSADNTDEFEEYLTRAGTNSADNTTVNSASGIAAANARLRSLLSPQPPEDPS
jgi:flagellar biogenesis protein FliO